MKRIRAILGAITVLVIAPFVLIACGGSSPSGTENTVTLAEDGQTITLRVGDSFLLELGEDYNWAPTVEDQTIVSRVKNIAVIRGAQGVYDALQPGKTTLIAVGDPVCRQATPPCEQPSRVFEIQIVVQ